MADGTVRPKIRRKPGFVPTPEVLPSALDEGDSVEFGVTSEVKHPTKGSFWVKAGATVRVRPDEDPSDTKERVEQFVLDMLVENVRELLA